MYEQKQNHGAGADGRALLKRRVSRQKFASTMAKLAPARVGMEACASSHYRARRLEQLGHTVQLINPAFVKPFVKSQEQDGTSGLGHPQSANRISSFTDC